MLVLLATMGAVSLLALAWGVSACVIPPPLTIEQDGGVNAPPVILSASPPDFAFPGDVVLNRQDQRRLQLTLADVDTSDVLWVRLFVDYRVTGVGSMGSETNFSSECVAQPMAQVERTADCSTATLCNSITDTDRHFLEAMVADREFLSQSDPRASKQPAFRAVPEGAGFSFRAWLMRCNAAPQ